MADSPSHNDVRQALRDALAAVDKDKGDDLLLRDNGTDWVVFSDPDTDGPGLFKQSYHMVNGKAVLDGKPVKVVQHTEYIPAGGDGDETPVDKQPKNLREATVEARQRLRKAAAKS